MSFLNQFRARARMAIGVQPLADGWGYRGQPLSRIYLEDFLHGYSSDIRGHCLEFQEDSYVTRYGGKNVSTLDIVHKENDNPRATIVADLTERNDIESASFDCIVCTYVLHIIPEPAKIVAEMFRILKPGGSLLIGVPNITPWYEPYPELWRFTAQGIRVLLERAFRPERVSVHSYGNALTSAGEIRGLVARDFNDAELAHHDPRFAMLVCARALK
jgi:SAM-dependent methyltransferase